jgi:hypothetical protein
MSNLETCKKDYNKVIKSIEILFIVSRMYLIIDKEKIFNDILNYHKKINNKKGLFYINGYTLYKTYVNEMVTKMKVLYEKAERNNIVKTLNIMKMIELMEELSDKVKYELKDNKICFVRDIINFYDLY